MSCGVDPFVACQGVVFGRTVRGLFDLLACPTSPVRSALEAANTCGLVTVHGNGTRSDVLRLAGVARARAVVIATNRDDAAVLIALTARELAPKAHIVAAVRERENVHLLRQSGANSVVVSSETAGRLLGMAITIPAVVELVEDLLTPEAGLASRNGRWNPTRSVARRGICPISCSG